MPDDTFSEVIEGKEEMSDMLFKVMCKVLICREYRCFYTKRGKSFLAKNREVELLSLPASAREVEKRNATVSTV